MMSTPALIEPLPHLLRQWVSRELALGNRCYMSGGPERITQWQLAPPPVGMHPNPTVWAHTRSPGNSPASGPYHVHLEARETQALSLARQNRHSEMPTKSPRKQDVKGEDQARSPARQGRHFNKQQRPDSTCTTGQTRGDPHIEPKPPQLTNQTGTSTAAITKSAGGPRNTTCPVCDDARKG